MNTPTEAELFADVLEYRAALEVLRAFDVGFKMQIERHNAVCRDGVYRPDFLVMIHRPGLWTVTSDKQGTLQQAAEQARERALVELINEPFVKKAKDCIDDLMQFGQR